MIELKSLTKKYGSFTAVDSIDLSVPDGELFGFLGPNGAGKSTTVKVLSTLARADAGHATVAGIDVMAQPARVREVIGTVGRTGNAELQSIHTHVHFELRAPFPLDWSSLGEASEIDAFNPYPSLRLADPKRR
mgnify:CR=1 FL=1